MGKGRQWGRREANAPEHCPLNWVLAHIISPKPALTQRQTTNELWAAEYAACKGGKEGVCLRVCLGVGGRKEEFFFAVNNTFFFFISVFKL